MEIELNSSVWKWSCIILFEKAGILSRSIYIGN